MTNLTKNDLQVIKGEARISDIEIADELGFADKKHLHQLIKRNREELADYGAIFLQTEEKIDRGRGRPEANYLLTEEQALLICMFARTPAARLARKKIIEVFQAYRKGDLYSLAVEAQAIPKKVAKAARGIEQLETDPDMKRFVSRLPHLKMWNGGRRPDFWGDIPVRTFLTASHRQVTLHQAVRIGRMRFGERCPSVTTVCTYWQRLDRLLGPAGFVPSMVPTLPDMERNRPTLKVIAE